MANLERIANAYIDLQWADNPDGFKPQIQFSTDQISLRVADIKWSTNQISLREPTSSQHRRSQHTTHVNASEIGKVVIQEGSVHGLNKKKLALQTPEECGQFTILVDPTHDGLQQYQDKLTGNFTSSSNGSNGRNMSPAVTEVNRDQFYQGSFTATVEVRGTLSQIVHSNGSKKRGHLSMKEVIGKLFDNGHYAVDGFHKRNNGYYAFFMKGQAIILKRKVVQHHWN